ncbi:hypothetical protein [Dactylosporangium cerinum]
MVGPAGRPPPGPARRRHPGRRRPDPPVGLDPQILPHFARALEKSIFLESD